MRALIIEDDPYIAQALKEALSIDGLPADIAPDGTSGAFRAITNDYDIILLDTMLPKKNGPEVCREIRAAGKQTPILSISAKADPTTKVTMLETGVDDYIAKPFSMPEVMARVRALLRRPHHLEGDFFLIDDLEIDTRSRTVTRGRGRAKRHIKLTRKEFDLLIFLARHRDSVVSRAMLLEHVWDETTDPFSNTIETHIMSLRKKIEAPDKKKLIHTIPTSGYKLSLSL